MYNFCAQKTSTQTSNISPIFYNTFYALHPHSLTQSLIGNKKFTYKFVLIHSSQNPWRDYMDPYFTRMVIYHIHHENFHPKAVFLVLWTALHSPILLNLGYKQQWTVCRLHTTNTSLAQLAEHKHVTIIMNNLCNLYNLYNLHPI